MAPSAKHGAGTTRERMGGMPRTSGSGPVAVPAGLPTDQGIDTPATAIQMSAPAFRSRARRDSASSAVITPRRPASVIRAGEWIR